MPITTTGTPPFVDSNITWNEKVIGKSKTAAPHENGMAICLALLKLSDIHAILDTKDNRNERENYKNGGLLVNGKRASLTIPDWMMPLPRPSKK